MHAERTARGWRKTIRIKQFLSADDSAANARKVAGEVAAVLKRTADFKAGRDEEFLELVDEFEGISTSGPQDYDEDLRPADHFNDCLDHLYDWADAERVWIG